MFRLWGSFSPGGRAPFEEDALEAMVEAEAEADEIDVSKATRIPMAAGVELLVSRDLDLPSPRSLVEIALLVRKLFSLK